MPRYYVRPLFLVVFLCLAWPVAALAADAFVLPDEARGLLSAEPALIVAVTSLNEMADQYVALLSALSDEDEASRDDVLKLLDQAVPALAGVVDLDRPLVVAAELPDMTGSGEPPFTFILPLRSDVTDRENLPGLESFAGHAFAGSYLAVSMAPDYAPTATPPALAAHLTDGVLSATLDLEQVLLVMGPLVEMGLANIPVRPAVAPGDSLPAAPAAAMAAAEAAALADLVRQLMASVSRLDFSLGRDQERLAWHTGLGVKPGSALDPGPQPPFAEALALSASLPADASFHQVTALDQTTVFETFREYYILTMMNSLQGLDPDQNEHYRAWIENYVDAMDIWASPMASALRLDDLGVGAQMIIAPKDPQGAVERLTGMLDSVNDLQIGYHLTRRPDAVVAGVNFRAWTVELDVEQFAALMPESGPMSGPGTLEVEQMVAILGKVLPDIHLGENQGRVYLTADDGAEALGTMVMGNARRTTPPVAVASAAAWAGPDAHQVVTGDILSIINWMTEWYNELDNAQLEVIKGNPVPFRGAFTLTGPEYGFDLSLDLQSLARLARAVQQLESTTHPSDPPEQVER
jgi:hypothetical protein